MGFVWLCEWDISSFANESGFVGLLMHHDGTVSILSRVSDAGVNGATTYCQVVADELGMRFEDVHMRPQYNEGGGEMRVPGGSGGMVRSIYGCAEAAKIAKQKILELATTEILVRGGAFRPPKEKPIPFPGLKPEDLDIKDSMVFEKANPSNTKHVRELVFDLWFKCNYAAAHEPVFAWVMRPVVKGLPTYYLARQTHFMEIEVDTETGGVEITKVVNVNDVGKAVSPETCEGQQYGGSYQGIGRGGIEETIRDPQTGLRLNANLLGYPVKLMADIGPIECILNESALGYGQYGTYGIGENIGSTTHSLIACALHNAIGVPFDDFPCSTPDKVLKALGKI